MPALPLARAPESLCLLRLSALGDVSHALPVVRTLQREWPRTRLTWVIGTAEHALLGDIPGIEFIVFDKRDGLAAYRALRRALNGRRFDVLLHMQAALRASIASLLIRADLRLGFDRARAKDGQWLFTNARIPARPGQHVLDSFFAFIEALGLTDRDLRWEIPVPAEARAFAAAQVPAGVPLLLVSPCASKAYRNWSAERYAAVADAAHARHGMAVALVGGSSAIERRYAGEISARMAAPVIDLVGRSSLKQLLALLERASVLLAPDSGPAHLATAVGTPVIGLYAATNPERAGPYLSRDYVVNAYPEAVLAQYGRPVDQLPWGARVRSEGVMERIEVSAVLEKLELMAARGLLGARLP